MDCPPAGQSGASFGAAFWGDPPLKTRSKILTAIGGLAVAAGAALYLPGLGLTAADHIDPPGRTDPAVDDTPDRAADIADIYAWHTAERINLVLTFAGPAATGLPAVYDPDVLYTINISNVAPASSTEIPIHIRFGPGAGAGEFGVQVIGIPGADGPIEGSVETTLMQNDVLVYAGLIDDPFFFDLQGFRESRDTGTLSFNNERDFFGAQNITAVIISVPRENVVASSNILDVWAETARLGGQI